MGAIVLFATLNFKRMFTPEPLPAGMQDAYLLWFANDYAARAKEELAVTETNVLVSFVRAIADRIGSEDPTNNSSGCFNPSNLRFVFHAKDILRLRPGWGAEPLVVFHLKHALQVIKAIGFNFKERDVTSALRDASGAHRSRDGQPMNFKCQFASLAMNTPGTNGPGFENGQRIPEEDLPWTMFTNRCDCWAVTRKFWDECVAESTEPVSEQVTLEQIRAVTIRTDEGLVNAYELFTNKNWRGFHTRDTPTEGYNFDDPAMDPAKLYEDYKSSLGEDEEVSTSRSTLDNMTVAVDLADLPSQDVDSMWADILDPDDAASSAMSLA